MIIPFSLPTDIQNIIGNFSDLWNENAAANIGGFHSPNDRSIPGWFTMDLDIKAKLSRFKMWWLTDSRECIGGHVKHFQIWESLTPASNGSWDGWTLLKDCTVIKPSGSSSGQLSNEDIEYAESGFEFKIPKNTGLPLGQASDQDMQYAAKGQAFTFPVNTPPVRYIRIKVLQTWDPASSDHSFFGELSFTGVIE